MKIGILLAAGFLVRLLAFYFIDFSFDADVITFQAWAMHLHRYGFGAFYSAYTFTDYPPVYMYILYGLGAVRSWFDWQALSPLFNFFTFLPAMLADLAIGLVIYLKFSPSSARRAGECDKWALFLAAAWVFNPAVILISGVWGQVESVFTLVLLLSLMFVREKNLLPGYILFAMAILTKPQALFLAPIFLFSAVDFVRSRKSVLYLMGSIIAAVGVMVLVSLPFGLRDTLDIFVSGAGLRGFASINAFNFWAFFGGNWQPWELPFFGTSYFAWGIGIVLIIILGSLAALFADRDRNDGKGFYLIAAALFVVIFVFSVRMHERYLFPGLLFLLIYFGETLKKRALWLYAAFSATYFVNCVEVLRWLRDESGVDVFAVSLPVVSFVNIVLGLAVIRVVYDSLRRENRPEISPIEFSPPMTLRDWGLVCALVVACSIMAFVNLGNLRSPQTTWEAQPEQTHASVDFGEYRQVSRFQYMMGVNHDRGFGLFAFMDGEWAEVYSSPGVDVFAWHESSIEAYAQHFVLTGAYGLRLQEIAFRDENDAIIPIANISPGAEALVDEQHMVPLARRFVNSTYFDEIYHPRTGYEYLHGLPVFETTHPPMGKNFIAASVAVFGMTPFGWRFPGAFVGVLMIPLIYAFARQVLKSNNFALFAAFIFTFDFMRFGQTRLATIDTYIVFFVMAMYFLMYLYVNGVEKNSLRRSLMLLAFCGVAMGFAIASKWQGVYGALGLPIVFFPAWWRLYLRDKKQAGITVAACFVFFVAVPVVVYALSYVPFIMAQGGGLGAIWDNQVFMFTYHSRYVLAADHPFDSNWWSWPLILRPLWLYVSDIAPGVRGTMVSMGNPAVWWVGIVAVVFACLKWNKRPGAAFLLVAFAAQFLPWIFVDRLTFIYHYFPSVPFMVIIIAWVFKYYVRSARVAVAYCVVVLGLFALFYPVLSGTPVDVEFVRNYLQWLPEWFFI